MPEAPAAVQTRELTRRFGQLIAVDRIGLHVPAGSVFGFLGPNGAGKTTAMRLMLGLIKPDSGTVEINGHDLARNREIALAGVGSLIETPALYPNLTGRETLRLAAHVRGHAVVQVQELLGLVDLEAAADRTVRTYSLGMRQRLALAKALVGQPRLLILDEPTNGLDPAGIVRMRELIRELPARFGTTVLLSSHQLSEIEQTADHCALLNKGAVVFQGAMPALMASARSRLVIESHDPEPVRAWFSERRIPVRLTSQALVVDAEFQLRERAELTRSLVAAGLQIGGLRVERPTLESLFLTMTNATIAEAA